MKTYIIILDKQIIGIARSANKIMARHLVHHRLRDEGKLVEFCKLQALEFAEDQVLIF